MPIQNNIRILTNCRSCDSNSLSLTLTRKKFPLYIWPLPKSESTRLEDINLYICNACGYMQLQNMNSKTISEIYREEAFNIENPKQNEDRLNLISNNNSNTFFNKKVLEIGGGRNSFITNLSKKTQKWVSDFTVNDSVKSAIDGYYIGDFLETEVKEKEFDFIFMFHILEHLNEPGKAINKVRGLLKKTGKFIVEVPNFRSEIQRLPYYTLFHMHISLFTDLALTSIMARHGFILNAYYKNDDVLLAEFAIGDKKNTINYKQDSLALIDSLKLNINKINDRLQRLEDGKFAIFGAGGATTLFLYNYPFLIERISYAFDNDKCKIGRYICNGRIPIVSPDNFEKKIDYVIVLEENHIQLMRNNNFKFINLRDFCYE